MADRRAFVAGFPIAHSRSPMIHNHWLKALNLPGSYERVEVTPDAFADFIAQLRAGVFVGGNVTIPHKEAAFQLVDRRDEAAEAIGAVNTLWMEGETLWGGNTDAYGYAANMDARVSGWDQCETAVVLGAGGAARAIIHALQIRKVPSIRIVNRTLARAQSLADHFGNGVSAHGEDETNDLLGDAGLVVNTTSLGMKGTPGPDLDLDHLPQTAVVSDIVYVPLQTPLLREAAQRGLRGVDGLGMLLHQAVPGFERWFDMRPIVDQALYDLVAADVEKAA
ncbi:shikimate dehydrogenase [Tianweitania sp. BSSL-BM11]|uniref:Shikimate dehydrogenase (NADP(+)) n=1 Tax=Tianweitania aestuarii TaxID=2814886 RepID=A0ABS5RXV9_9HYPH|nr:shikimate dehydrogenase [Tianweitania aestuarii]MBS9721640.1 shikimate dehydrogenase [Tianweitania aestuarii]